MNLEMEKDLVFGLLAVRLGKVPVETVLVASRISSNDRSTDLASILVNQGALSLEDSSSLRRLVDDVFAVGSREDEESALSTLLAQADHSRTADALYGDTTVIESASRFTSSGAISQREIPGRYSYKREYAKGGMGRILEVCDNILNRDVAMKELLPALLDTPGVDSKEFTRRFLREAKITGGLEHPSIVPIYELGQRDTGSLYYTMKLVRGRSLADAIDEAHNLRERLLLLPHFIDICNAVAYAHSKGVIHRDLKPGNIMVGEFGETVVLDWGLAKTGFDSETPNTSDEDQYSERHDGTSEDTLPGTVLGTPGYMAPEQSIGDVGAIDERSDIYALGAVLYKLLTKRVPHEASTLAEIFQKLQTQDPKPIRELEPTCPRELAAICGRALAREKADRYLTANALATDIQKFHSGALVGAYEYSLADYVRHFAKKYRTMLSAVVFAILLLIGLAAVYQVRLVRERDNVLLANKSLVWENYISNLTVAQKQISDGNFSKALDVLSALPEELRGWEWGYLYRLSTPALLTVDDAAWRVLGVNPVGVLWTAEPSRDGRYILAARNYSGEKAVFDFLGARIQVYTPPSKYIGYGGANTFSADSASLFVSVRHSFDRIDLSNGEVSGSVSVEPDDLRQLVSSPSGRFLAGRVNDQNGPLKTLVLWDGSTLEEYARLDFPFQGNGYLLGFHSDRELYFATDKLRCWEISTGNVSEITSAIVGVLATTSPRAALYLPSGVVEIWDLATRERLCTIDESFTKIGSFDISPDGLFIAASKEGALEWSLFGSDDGIPISVFRGHSYPIRGLEFSSNSKYLISTAGDAVGSDGIQIWDLDDRRGIGIVTPVRLGEESPMDPVYTAGSQKVVSYASGGDEVIVGDGAGNVDIWTVPQFTGRRISKAHEDGIRSVVVSSRKRYVASASADGTVKIWDYNTLELIKSIRIEGPFPPWTVAFSPDEQQIAVGSGSMGTDILCTDCAGLYSIETGEKSITFHDPYAVRYIAYSPDGKWLVLGGWDPTFSIRDAETGQTVYGEALSREWAMDAVFSPDSRFAVLTGSKREPLMWDLKDSRAVFQLEGAEVVKTAFHPDGTRFLAVGRKLRIHAASDGRELITLEHALVPESADWESNEYLPANFTPNGDIIYSRIEGGRIVMFPGDPWLESELNIDVRQKMRQVGALLTE